MIWKCLFALFFVFWFSPCWAATIYVDVTLVGTCVGGAGTSYRVAQRDCGGADGTTAYKTIEGGLGAVAASDTVSIRVGTYTETGIPYAGFAQDNVTIQNYGTEEVIWKSAHTYAFLEIINISGTTISGIIFDGSLATSCHASGCAMIQLYAGSNHKITGCTFRNNTVATYAGIVIGSHDESSTLYTKILSNTFHNLTGPAILIDPNVDGEINWVLVKGNTAYDIDAGAGGAIQVGSGGGGVYYAVVKSNTVHGLSDGESYLDMGGHVDRYPAYYLAEGNILYLGTGAVKTCVKFHPITFGIFRENVCDGAAMQLYGPAGSVGFSVKNYHNTYNPYSSGMGTIQISAEGDLGEDFGGYYFKNNYFGPSLSNYFNDVWEDPPTYVLNTDNVFWLGNYFHPGHGYDNQWSYRANSTEPIGSTPGDTKNYDFSAAAGLTSFESDFTTVASSNTLDHANATTVIFVNPATRNYNLAADSPMKDKGVNLTTVTTATGSGATFSVGDASYFFDGWGWTDAGGDWPAKDTLKVGSSTCIVDDINYVTNSITCTGSISWTVGDGVNLASHMLGSAPDPGAYEYGGEGSASIIVLGTGATIKNLGTGGIISNME